MRTLIINALRLNRRPTGPGRHIQFLIEQWSRMPLPFDRVILVSPRRLGLDGLGAVTHMEQCVIGDRWPNVLWEQLMVLPVIAGAAVLFCPAYTCPLLSRTRTVVANHGIYEGLPREFSWWTRLRATPLDRFSAKRAARVIANSLSTKVDLVRYFRIPQEKIGVVYPAAHEIFFQPRSDEDVAAEVERALGERSPYVLFVGKLARRRHIPELIRALATARKRHRLPHRLLIVGPNTTGLPLDDLFHQAGLDGVARYIPYLEQKPLARLYAGADLFVLPTTHEGISQTMFEAMASGTPVLSVDHPTLVEGAGDSVYVVPTPAVEDLATGMAALLADPALRTAYAARGRAHVTRFSWRETAERTLEILDRVATVRDGRSS
jgi:glycosyltransferase involved in cell wall biosynthesis